MEMGVLQDIKAKVPPEKYSITESHQYATNLQFFFLVKDLQLVLVLGQRAYQLRQVLDPPL